MVNSTVDFNFVSVISRDWQLERSLSIFETLNIPRSQIFFISEELWTHGNASHAAELLGLTKNLIVLRRTSELSEKIWTRKDANREVIDVRDDLVQDAIESLCPLICNQKRTLFCFDGYGPFISRPLGLVYEAILETVENSGVLFFEHGRLLSKLKLLLLDFSNFFRIIYRAFYDKNPVRLFWGSHVLLMSKYSIARARSINPLFARVHIVPDFLLIKNFKEPTLACKKHDLLKGDGDIVIVTPGLTPQKIQEEMGDFLSILPRICSIIPSNNRIFLKGKPGEYQVLSKRLESLEIPNLILLDDEVCMFELINPKCLYLFPSSSNSGLELLSKGMKAIAYNWALNKDPLFQEYKNLKVPIIDFALIPDFNSLVRFFNEVDLGHVKKELEARAVISQDILKVKFREILESW